jgi:hypothetical protein
MNHGSFGGRGISGVYCRSDSPAFNEYLPLVFCDFLPNKEPAGSRIKLAGTVIGDTRPEDLLHH